SRWTQGAGVVKGLHPFAKLGGRHRSFIETHLARTRRAARAFDTTIPHVFTTSHLTHAPIEQWLRANQGNDFQSDAALHAPPSTPHASVPIFLSPGRSIGLRLVPTVRDLQFAWEETAQQKLDEQ